MRIALMGVLVCLFLGGCKSSQKSTSMTEPVPSLINEAGWVWEGSEGIGLEAGQSSPYVLTFENEKDYSLKLDVNSCFGSYSMEGNTLTISDDMACTEACCDHEWAFKFTQGLAGSHKLNWEKGKLVLRKDSEKVLVFMSKNK
ncbi:MAG: META domain-containing protein [Bacteroidota bacterium]